MIPFIRSTPVGKNITILQSSQNSSSGRITTHSSFFSILSNANRTNLYCMAEKNKPKRQEHHMYTLSRLSFCRTASLHFFYCFQCDLITHLTSMAMFELIIFTWTIPNYNYISSRFGTRRFVHELNRSMSPQTLCKEPQPLSTGFALSSKNSLKGLHKSKATAWDSQKQLSSGKLLLATQQVLWLLHRRESRGLKGLLSPFKLLPSVPSVNHRKLFKKFM